MKKIFIAIIFSLLFSITNANNIADSIVIVRDTYQDNYLLAFPRKVIVTSKCKIKRFISELEKVDTQKNILTKFKVDVDLIKTKPEELLDLYDDRNKINYDWNVKQKEYIYKKLSNIDNYLDVIKIYFARGSMYSGHGIEYQFLIKIYHNGHVINSYMSQKRNLYGYNIPYVDKNGNNIYNYNVDKLINRLFNDPVKRGKPLRSMNLLKRLVREIISNNGGELFDMNERK